MQAAARATSKNLYELAWSRREHPGEEPDRGRVMTSAASTSIPARFFGGLVRHSWERPGL
jgi:hypothetical protein